MSEPRPLSAEEREVLEELADHGVLVASARRLFATVRAVEAERDTARYTATAVKAERDRLAARVARLEAKLWEVELRGGGAG